MNASHVLSLVSRNTATFRFCPPPSPAQGTQSCPFFFTVSCKGVYLPEIRCYYAFLCLFLPGFCLHFLGSPSPPEDDLILCPLVVLVALPVRPIKVSKDTKQLLHGKL